MNTVFLFISGPEIMVIMLIVVMVFGADKIPEIARGLGKGMRQIKDATNDIKQEIKDSSDIQKSETKSIKNTANEATKGVSEEFKRVQKDIEDITGPIKRQF
ncbi:Sec-independent protein translocase subunit TatA/TatB [Polaribacter cellanae]|uniref:Sec-independent protein translocase protein TatA n=1 Tax=Polaribacter cellanae TaxID=2818493 RepID=A0A975CQG1_9FLAO|nr:twin-arginine translocase TatA/TatE family subunit [Polaribacter cellanae]QTE21326.1 twin-arginine translocase TatA/TatE family subunit [Polaribacter cellanae]